MTIRDFTPDDYQAMVDIQNAIFPDNPAVVEDWIEGDTINSDPKCKRQRWVVEMDGKVVAVGQYAQSPWAYHPQHFGIMIRVLPEYQRRGIGAALYDHLMAALVPYDPIQLAAGTREDQPGGVKFLEARGFHLHVRAQRSGLSPSEFDPAQFAAAEQRLIAEGFTFRSLAELADDPERNRKAYELEVAVAPDIPGFDDFTPPGLEQYEKEVINAPTLSKGLYLIAVDADGTYAGMTCLWADRASDMLFTGLTGVRREYRRRGIATALKTRAITWAKTTGCSRINTDNADTNPMLQLNYALGFRPLPAYMDYRKELDGKA